VDSGSEDDEPTGGVGGGTSGSGGGGTRGLAQRRMEGSGGGKHSETDTAAGEPITTLAFSRTRSQVGPEGSDGANPPDRILRAGAGGGLAPIKTPTPEWFQTNPQREETPGRGLGFGMGRAYLLVRKREGGDRRPSSH